VAIHYPSHLLRVLVPVIAAYLAVLVYLSQPRMLILGITTVVLFGVVALVESWAAKLAPKYSPVYGSRWADESELTPELITLEQAKKGIILGYAYGKRFGIVPGSAGRKELGHVLVTAPSRRGKGLHLITNLLSWSGSAVVVDIKGENFARTAGYRAKIGQRILVLDPTGVGHRYDPFAELSSDEGLNSICQLILEPEKDGSNRAFGLRASAILFAMMKTAALEKRPILKAIREYTAMGLVGCAKSLAHVQDDEVQRRLTDFLGYRASEMDWDNVAGNKFLDNSWQGMIAKLSPFFSQGILAMTAGSDFKAIDLVTEPTTLYLVFRESDIKYTGKAMQMVLLGLVNALMRSFDNGADQPLPTLFCFDEAGTVVVPELDRFVATAAGRGISALIYIQDLPQFESIYGCSAAATIKANCHTQLYYRPLENTTASYISDLLGKRAIDDTRYSKSPAQAELGEGFGMRGRELMTSDEVGQLSLERLIGFVDVVQGKRPVLLQRIKPWYLPHGKSAMRLNPPGVEVLPGVDLKHIPKPEVPKSRKSRGEDDLDDDYLDPEEL
jgi:type IV secretion system protein VirD4